MTKAFALTGMKKCTSQGSTLKPAKTQKKTIFGKIKQVLPFQKRKQIRELEENLQAQNLLIRNLMTQINTMKEQNKATNAKIFVNNAPQKTPSTSKLSSNMNMASSMSKLDFAKISKTNINENTVRSYPYSTPTNRTSSPMSEFWFQAPEKVQKRQNKPKKETHFDRSSVSISILL